MKNAESWNWCNRKLTECKKRKKNWAVSLSRILFIYVALSLFWVFLLRSWKLLRRHLQELEFDSKKKCATQLKFLLYSVYFLDVSVLEGRGCKNANCISALASTCWANHAFLHILKLPSTTFCDWIYFYFHKLSINVNDFFFTHEILFNIYATELQHTGS